MISVGGIVSVGGGTGGSSGSSSGIQSINSQTGPSITINGVNGINVNANSNIITIDGTALSGLIGSGGTQSGVIGVNGIDVQQIAGDFVVDASALSGIIPSTSGIESINGQSGPHITLVGINGVSISSIGNGQIIVDTAGASGVPKYTASFNNITSGQFVHNLGTRDVIVQVYEESPLAEQIIPDRIIRDTPNTVSLLFNMQQSGRVVIVG